MTAGCAGGCAGDGMLLMRGSKHLVERNRALELGLLCAADANQHRSAWINAVLTKQPVHNPKGIPTCGLSQQDKSTKVLAGRQHSGDIHQMIVRIRSGESHEHAIRWIGKLERADIVEVKASW